MHFTYFHLRPHTTSADYSNTKCVRQLVRLACVFVVCLWLAGQDRFALNEFFNENRYHWIASILNECKRCYNLHGAPASKTYAPARNQKFLIRLDENGNIYSINIVKYYENTAATAKHTKRTTSANNECSTCAWYEPSNSYVCSISVRTVISLLFSFLFLFRFSFCLLILEIMFNCFPPSHFVLKCRTHLWV